MSQTEQTITRCDAILAPEELLLLTGNDRRVEA
jgi:hypothetical protein